MKDESARISPTAHYTGYVWYRHGLSHPALRTPLGALLYYAVQPTNLVYGRVTGGPTLESVLLARHRAIDLQLSAAIRSGRVGQVIEIAAGLSPRGVRFVETYPDLTYIEGDLQDMSGLKRRRLESAGALSERHHVVYVDALLDEGEHSLSAAATRYLDPKVGTAIITEGLIPYFDRDTVESLWRRIAGVLSRFPSGQYLSDAYPRDEIYAFEAARAFSRALKVFARGGVYMHHSDSESLANALHEAGFPSVRVEPPIAFGVSPASPSTDNDILRIIDARS
ncbi:MAG: O-methyltransferase involved in polyketide biosynthesis [Myxococcota bacterium]|jgi:O-methyltransferase involved in polyketide biosynthesis